MTLHIIGKSKSTRDERQSVIRVLRQQLYIPTPLTVTVTSCYGHGLRAKYQRRIIIAGARFDAVSESKLPDMNC